MVGIWGQVKANHYAVIIKNYIFEENDLFPLKMLEFEGLNAMVPNSYDKYLKCIYGDYMKLPPESERYPHEGAIDIFNPCNHKEVLFWEKSGS